MNKKGQSLIVFVLILPIIIFFIAFFINSMIMFMESNRLNGIIKDNMEIILNKNIRDSIIIKNTIEKNVGIKVIVNIENDDINIKGLHENKNIFDNIFKIKNSNYEVSFCGNYESKIIDKC